MRNTKIICSIGPASNSLEKLKELMENGMSVARINFSHDNHESHGKVVDTIKQAREEMGVNLPILLDTKGPEIRTQVVAGGNVELKKGQKFTFVTEEIEGNNERVSVTYEDFAKDLKVGNRVLLDDGLIGLVVDEIKNNEVICTVLNSGVLGSRKGVNLPDTSVNLPAMTKKDEADLLFGIEKGFDFIGASFIRSAKDLKTIKKLLADNGGSHIKIISKIENQEGLDNIDEILEITDGIMVARGDLGVEIPTERVPEAQKMLVNKCNAKGKLVVVATQMLDSMIDNPRPTRAEASDVANSVHDGTHATMLSGETAKGDYPVESVSTMAKINQRTEETIDYTVYPSHKLGTHESIKGSIENAIGQAVDATTKAMAPACIVMFTETFENTVMLTRFKPNAPILALTNNEVVLRQLNLAWGTVSDKVEKVTDLSVEELTKVASEKAISNGLAKSGETILVVTQNGLNIVKA